MPFNLTLNKFTVGDDVIWTSGAHSIKIGGNIQRVQDNTYAPFQVGGVWTFASLTTFFAGTPSQVIAQFSNVQYPGADATKDWRELLFSPYVQDQWQVTSKLYRESWKLALRADA